MNTAITIRKASEDDLPAIVTIYNATIPGRMVTADTEPVSVSERLPWLRAHQANPKRPLWVAEQDGSICGWMSFSSFYGRPAYRATVEISIYLDERFQGQGIGTFLLQQAIAEALDLGIKTILAFVFVQNTPSLRLFARFGFERWGLLPRVAKLDDAACDLVILGRRIAP